MKPENQLAFELWKKQKEEEMKKATPQMRRDKFTYEQGDLQFYPPKK